MKLLFDQNLAPRLVRQLEDIFPDSTHISRVGLERALDREVWRYARDNNFTIVTKDADFGELSVVLGYPPKVVWLRLGNCTTQQIGQALRRECSAITILETDVQIGVLSVI